MVPSVNFARVVNRLFDSDVVVYFQGPYALAMRLMWQMGAGYCTV